MEVRIGPSERERGTDKPSPSLCKHPRTLGHPFNPGGLGEKKGVFGASRIKKIPPLSLGDKSFLPTPGTVDLRWVFFQKGGKIIIYNSSYLVILFQGLWRRRLPGGEEIKPKNCAPTRKTRGTARYFPAEVPRARKPTSLRRDPPGTQIQ